MVVNDSSTSALILFIEVIKILDLIASYIVK